jgi:starch-binding outer membrane protein, SusD/RagB family
MKQIGYHILLLILFGACTDQLDQAPISDPSAANFYRNEADFRQAVNATYQALNPFPVRYLDLSEVRSDNIYSPGRSGVREYTPVNNFENTLATNGLIIRSWNENFNGIMRANAVLVRIEQVLEGSGARDQMIGEAKFLRAFFYFDLVRTFGSVPLILNEVTPSEALEIPRSSVADVYAAIITDLNDAIGLLPASYSGVDVGRATKGAARGMLGLVYMTRSGPVLHPGGPCLGTNEYSQAIALFDQIISDGQYAMGSDYAMIFSYDNENSPEIVFDIQNMAGNTGNLGLGSQLPTNWYTESYARGEGAIPFAGGVVEDGLKIPAKDLIDSYEASDVRLDFNVLSSYVDVNGNTVNDGEMKKWLDLNKKPIDRFNWGINFPFLRITDILMMKAEAILMGGSPGSQSDVNQVVDDVRNRAGLAPLGTDVTLDILLDERRREFLGEGTRWHTLVRTGKVVDAMNAWRNYNAAQGLLDNGKIKQVTNDYIIYPIPDNEIFVAPGLYEQNPGYQ